MIPRTRSSSDIYFSEEGIHNMRDWRAAISTPLTYRIGNSTLHFRSHLHFLGIIVAISVITLLFFVTNGKSRSYMLPIRLMAEKSIAYNSSYPLTTPIRVKRSTKYRIAVVADLDTDSKYGDIWKSYLHYGHLTISDSCDEVSISWDADEKEIKGNTATGGRGMELSELQVYDGKLYSIDDRTGIVYHLYGEKVVPWVILSDGSGKSSKGFKGEWSTVKDSKLVVGGLGKEWTTSKGEVLNHDPMWVKEIGFDGSVRHIDWRDRYIAVRHAAGISWPGYMIHEAVGWSTLKRKWIFLPRRMSKDRYDDVKDEKMGTNIMITADETFEHIEVKKVGNKIPTHGFSSFKFVPGTEDSVILALKSEEFNGNVATYIMVFNVDGTVLYPEKKIGERKFEGVEFV